MQYEAPDDRRYELVEGRLVPMRQPSIAHGSVADFWQETLKSTFRSGRLPYVARLDYPVQVDSGTERIVTSRLGLTGRHRG
ncbi:MAG: hypothetical protein HC838_01895 [Spirulinaceae cyanobacterium RM2_2_10]|nr:hypothetical protein [Spirulinaceae cyanobacterium SM2_1_0]NJO19061.1 hypothetical protein [Spirulinaceae cyanobacterium RM2_2_10]